MPPTPNKSLNKLSEYTLQDTRFKPSKKISAGIGGMIVESYDGNVTQARKSVDFTPRTRGTLPSAINMKVLKKDSQISVH